MKKLLGVVVAALCFVACGFAGEADPQLHLGEGRLRLVAPGGRLAWERTVEGTPFRGLGPTFRRSEEIYVQASPPFDRKTCEVLISMDLDDPTTKKSENSWGKEKKPLRTDGDYAVSWTKRYGGGCIFYTSFGHDKRAFFDPARFGHMLLGLHHCLGDRQ